MISMKMENSYIEALRIQLNNSAKPGINFYLNWIYQLISREFEKDSEILEIGAGGGSVILRLAKIRPGIEFVGIEPTLNGCKLIQDQADRLGLTNVSVIQALGQDDVSDLGQFDFIYSNLCLEQIADKDVVTAILRNIRLTSSSGRCSFMEPWLDGNNYLQRKYLRFQGYLNAHSSVLRELGFLNITSINSVVHHNPRFRVSHVTCSDL